MSQEELNMYTANCKLQIVQHWPAIKCLNASTGSYFYGIVPVKGLYLHKQTLK